MHQKGHIAPKGHIAKAHCIAKGKLHPKSQIAPNGFVTFCKYFLKWSGFPQYQINFTNFLANEHILCNTFTLCLKYGVVFDNFTQTNEELQATKQYNENALA